MILLYTELRKLLHEISFILGTWFVCICKFKANTTSLINLRCFNNNCIINLRLIDINLTLDTIFLSFQTNQNKIIFFLFNWFHGTVFDFEMIDLSWLSICRWFFILWNTSKSEIFGNLRWWFDLFNIEIRLRGYLNSLVNGLPGFTWPSKGVFIFRLFFITKPSL